MIIFNVGGQPLDGPEPRSWIADAQRHMPDGPLVILSDREDRNDIIAAIRLGVRGFIPSSTSPVVALQALTFILNGGQFFPPTALLQVGARASSPNGAGRRGPRFDGDEERSGGLTPRQIDVLRLLRVGRPNKVIARELNMCEATVKVHVRQILRRLGASNRTEAALMSPTLLQELENAMTHGDAADFPEALSADLSGRPNGSPFKVMLRGAVAGSPLHVP
jgi:DNA-binding NarL/FixJ family response regulator